MKNYYEILEISMDAGVEDIRKAYIRAKSAYSEESMAVYSLYTPDEKKAKLEELNRIYSVLMDPERRAAYNRTVKPRPRVNQPPLMAQAPRETREPQYPTHPGLPQLGSRGVFEEYNDAGAFRDKLSLKKGLVVMDGQSPMTSERFRMLFNRIEQFNAKNSCRTFAVTSAIKGEGKTMTSVNLAYIAATEFKKKVLVLEGDLRNPSISSTYLNLGRVYGLVDVLKGDVELKSAINRLDDTSLHFLPARASVRNSSSLLDTPKMREVLREAKDSFDYVIVDSPPVLPLVDINILSKAVEAFVLVVRAGKTPKDMVVKAASSLPKDSLVGIVLNGASDGHMKKYYY